MSAIDTTQDPDFLPLFAAETETAILARWEDWANEGLDPAVDVDAWEDTREGALWRTVLMIALRECARLYDIMGTEAIMAGMALWSWGTYLDDLAATFEIQRLPATPAQGVETFTGPVGTEITAGTRVSAVPSTEDAPAPEFTVPVGGTIPGVSGSGSVNLTIQAVDGGSAGNVGAGAITAPSTPLPGITLTNAAATTGGTDPETDEALRLRLLEALSGAGGGSKRDYRKWAGSRPGVGHVTVVSNPSGAGTVLVVISAPDGSPASSAVVTDVQTYLDPNAGQGDGVAPVGASVTVAAASVLAFAVAGTLSYEQGYSMDGAGGTIAVRPLLEKRLAAYIQTRESGDAVVYNHVLGLIVTTTGVHNVAGLTVNGAGVDVTLATSPTPQHGQLTTPVALT